MVKESEREIRNFRRHFRTGGPVGRWKSCEDLDPRIPLAAAAYAEGPLPSIGSAAAAATAAAAAMMDEGGEGGACDLEVAAEPAERRGRVHGIARAFKRVREECRGLRNVDCLWASEGHACMHA